MVIHTTESRNAVSSDEPVIYAYTFAIASIAPGSLNWLSLVERNQKSSRAERASGAKPNSARYEVVVSEHRIRRNVGPLGANPVGRVTTTNRWCGSASIANEKLYLPSASVRTMVSPSVTQTSAIPG